MTALIVFGENVVAEVHSFNGDVNPLKKTLDDTKSRYEALTAVLENAVAQQKATADKVSKFDEEVVAIEQWVVTTLELVKVWDGQETDAEPDDIKKQKDEAEVDFSLYIFSTCGVCDCS